MRSIKTLVIAMSLLVCTASFTVSAAASESTRVPSSLQVQHIRNATAKIHYAGKTFLIDPFLAKKGTYPGFPGTFHSELRNPTVELPLPVVDIMRGVDAVIITHTHLDHWDGGDHNFIPKSMTLFVQHEADAKLVRSQGYTDVRIVAESTEFKGVRLSKTGGQHGTSVMYNTKPLGELLGDAMGVIFQAPNEKTIYIAGDTIWNSIVDETLVKHRPDVVILNTGDARIVGYMGSIIMGKDDVLRAYKIMPNATIIATHMDAINHLTLSRKELRDYVKQHKIEDRVRIPEDGEILKF